MAGALEHQVPVVAGAPGTDIEALIGLLVDQDVGRLRGSQHVAEELVLAFGFLVLDGVKQGAIIRRPHHRADPLCLVGQHFAGSQVLEVQSVLPESGGVGRIGQQVAIVRDGQCANARNPSPAAIWFISSMISSAASSEPRLRQ